MENEPPAGFATHNDARASKKGRFMGKLFGRDRKTVSGEEPPRSPADLDDFFHGSTDKLDVAHPAPPPPRPPVLGRLDISKATCYPDAVSVDHSQRSLPLLPRSRSPKIRRNKGLVVRFVDTFPELIGHGGDECETPTLEISKQKPIRPAVVTAATAPARPSDTIAVTHRAVPNTQQEAGFVPTPLRRAQTGYSTISDAPEREIPAGENISSRFLDTQAATRDERPRSFIEIHQAEMREAEGLAFASARRASATTSPQPQRERQETQTPHAPGQRPQSKDDQAGHLQLTSSPEQRNPPQFPAQTDQAFKPYQPSQSSQSSRPSSAVEASPNHRILQRPFVEQSPSSIYSSSSLANRQPSSRQGSKLSDAADQWSSSQNGPLHSTDRASTPADEALDIFAVRTRHLFALFRLHSEMVKPLVAYSPSELARAAVWWFLRGRMALEMSVRERPSTPQDQQRKELAREQAYSDLSKSYWLSQDVIPDIAESKALTIEADVDETQRALRSNLQKLSLSMQRNGFLPPEEAFLPQTIDKSIWVEYPSASQDIVSLLRGSSSSTLTHGHSGDPGMNILETLPLGDSPSCFCFNRVPADVFLVEQGAHESSRLYFPCFLSVIRPQNQGGLAFVIASQNGALQFRIQDDTSAGPVWEDVRWRSDACCIDVRLPRGFILVVQCAPLDFQMLWNMYDFNAKVLSSLHPRKDEHCVFRSTLKTFQYFDSDALSRQFPKEATPNCDIALFEHVMRQAAATGPRCYHRAFRIAVVTGVETKSLSGVNQVYLPQQPVRYGFLRGEHNDPALSLKFESGRQKGSMVMTFADEKERLRLHSLLIGTALRNDEQIYCETPLRGLWFAKSFGDLQSFQALSALPWGRVRVINDDGGGDRPSCVLAEKLRVVIECKEGTITDRVNVAPGELKLRLDVANPSCLMVFRHPQPDLTMAVTETKLPREVTLNLSRDLETLQQVPTLRTYMFPALAELHQFQEAITGFGVTFDGIASTFAISRRRMVVPIYKKWEAGATRIQVIQQDKIIQLLAFFDDFAHGKCMSFALKGTDVLESFGKGPKAGLKFVDAKFPMPRVVAGENTVQDTADTAFVCLDLPELPGEHDDISVTFESEADRDRLIQCLPAPVKTSRLGLKK